MATTNPAAPTDVPWDVTRADFNDWEGRIPYMYVDTRGFVTVGVGYMLPHAGAAAELPFVWREGGQRATTDEIRTEFDRVHQQPMGKLAQAYKPFTKLDLPDAAIDALLKTTADRFELGLTQNFTGYRNYPAPAKRALLDMAYNLGIDGLLKFKKLKAAVEAGNWAGAAAESYRNGPSKDRNDWTRQMFLKAQG